MPEEIEVETKELQEAIDELNEEKAERAADEKRAGWTKYIGLSTAVLAVFAALGALQAGALVNEALINQVKASDSWNEYQASREKTHLYAIALNTILDTPAPPSSASTGATPPSKARIRAKQYGAEIKKEQQKSKDLSKKATDLEKESRHQVHKHEFFAYSVALIQVAIALGAIAALAKIKYVWYLSLICGLLGIILFIGGILPR